MKGKGMSTPTSMPKEGKAAEKPGHGAKAIDKGSCDMSMPKNEGGMKGHK